jgi:hypothetical protein
MKTLYAFGIVVLAWFGSFLALFLCITVVTAVITGMAGVSYLEVMAESYKGFAGISGVVASVFAIISGKELNLITFEPVSEHIDEQTNPVEKDDKTSRVFFYIKPNEQ